MNQRITDSSTEAVYAVVVLRQPVVDGDRRGAQSLLDRKVGAMSDLLGNLIYEAATDSNRDALVRFVAESMHHAS